MNYGALRPLAARVSDSTGYATFDLGAGTYYVYAGKATEHSGETIIIKPGETLYLALDLKHPEAESFWLNYGADITPILDTQEGGASHG